MAGTFTMENGQKLEYGFNAKSVWVNNPQVLQTTPPDVIKQAILGIDKELKKEGL